MKTVVTYTLARTIEGQLDAVIAAELPPPVALADVVASLRELAFICETVAHLQGKEKELLPSASRARALLYTLTSGEG